MPRSFEPFEAPALWNPHFHARQDTDEDTVVGPLLENALEGGAVMVGVMPNTAEGLLTADDVIAYRDHCNTVGPGPEKLRILSYLQLTAATQREDIDSCLQRDIKDAKVYPLDRTTKSQNGVRNYEEVLDIITYACAKGMNVHFHPEHPMMLFENRDAEYLFLPIMDMIMEATKDMLGVIVWEHGTDARCIPFWEVWGKTGRFYVTLTAHHLATSENETFGDVQATCKPPIKTRYDRRGLVELVKLGYHWVMAGGDDAAHDKSKKHGLGPCACGAYTSTVLAALYGHALHDLLYTEAGRQIFIDFTSGNAKRLYGGEDGRTLTFTDEPTRIPAEYTVGTWTVEPFMAGQEISCSASWC